MEAHWESSLASPILVKAAAGGSSRGMVVKNEKDLREQFKVPGMKLKRPLELEIIFVEKYLENPNI